MSIEVLRDKASKLPLMPGVYIMTDVKGEVIYIGKAKQLKSRVSSYFHGAHNAKTEAMISHIADFNVIISNSEFEALVLENSLIKHHMPKYNILLKDDKGYPFIRLDITSDYPRFTIASFAAEDGAVYFGPYGGRGTSKTVINEVSKALRLPSCSRVFPRDIGKWRPCLEYHIGSCDAYCQQDASRENYIKAIKSAEMILQGKTSSLINEMRREMESAAENLMFERAAEIRDRIKAVCAVQERQTVLTGFGADTDAIGFFRGETKSCFVVLHYISGSLLGKDSEIIETPLESDAEAVSALARQFYLNGRAIPKYILLPFDISDTEDLERLFSETAGHRVYALKPLRGDRRRFIDTAVMNAREETERVTSAEERRSKTAAWLEKAMKLTKPPERIEAFDVSNTGNTEIVAAMTVFLKGKPLKKAYRKFKIEGVEKQDDYHSMAEAVYRRIARFVSGDKNFSPLPDVMLIDGGAEHARAAKSAVEANGISVPVFGMVKDERHRTRALVTPDGEEIGIAAFPPAFALIGIIQEETHRFAVEYHRLRRSKTSFTSELDKIPGIGDRRKNDLLRVFGSVKRIESANIDELEKAVPKNIAKAIQEYFNLKKNSERIENENESDIGNGKRP